MKEPKIISVKFHTGVPIGKAGTEQSATVMKPTTPSLSNRLVTEIKLMGTWAVMLRIEGDPLPTIVPMTNITHLRVEMPEEKAEKGKATA